MNMDAENQKIMELDHQSYGPGATSLHPCMTIYLAGKWQESGPDRRPGPSNIILC